MQNVAKEMKDWRRQFQVDKRKLADLDPNLDQLFLMVQSLADDLTNVASLETQLSARDVAFTAMCLAASYKRKALETMT